MGEVFFKAFLVGVCASAPIGPVAIYIMQKTLNKGQLAGFVSSIGACVIDTLYACVALLAIGYVQNILYTHENLLLIIGGAIVAGLGTGMMLSNPFRKQEIELNGRISQMVQRDPVASDALKSALLTISNPGAIFMTFALISLFGIEPVKAGDWTIAPIILSCAAGSASYWLLFTFLLSLLRHRFRISTILWTNRISGAVIIVLGFALLFEGIYNILIFTP